MMSEEIVNELTRAVGRIEGKLDSLLTHGDRISNLEKWRAWTAGIAVAVSLLLTTAWNVFHGK
jgi:hypothetical protein